MDLIERSVLLKDLDDLKKSPWYNIDNPFIQQGMRECMDMIETQCIKKAPAVEAIPISWFQAKAYSWEKDLKTACREDAESIRHIQDTYLGMIEEWRKEE